MVTSLGRGPNASEWLPVVRRNSVRHCFDCAFVAFKNVFRPYRQLDALRRPDFGYQWHMSWTINVFLAFLAMTASIIMSLDVNFDWGVPADNVQCHVL